MKNTMSMLLTFAALFCLAGPAMADKIVDRGNVGWEGTVQGITERGIVLLSSATRAERAFPFAQVKSISADGVAELEQADLAMLAGDAAKAVGLYERARTRGNKPWIKEYANARLVQVYGESDKPGQAVKSYIELAQAKSALTAQIKLPAIRDPKGREADAALAAINAALAADGNNPNVERLKEIKISLLIQRGDPKEVMPMIEEQLKSKDVEIRSQARLKQIEMQIQMGQVDAAMKNLALARTELDAMHQPRLFFHEGRCLYTQQKYLEAAICFMRVPVQFPMGKELASESLVWAAKSMQQANAPQHEVAAALQEAVTDFAGTAGAAEAAKLLRDMSQPQQQ